MGLPLQFGIVFVSFHPLFHIANIFNILCVCVCVHLNHFHSFNISKHFTWLRRRCAIHCYKLLSFYCANGTFKQCSTFSYPTNMLWILHLNFHRKLSFPHSSGVVHFNNEEIEVSASFKGKH